MCHHAWPCSCESVLLAQAGLRFAVILFLGPLSTGLTSVHYHVQPCLPFRNKYCGALKITFKFLFCVCFYVFIVWMCGDRRLTSSVFFTFSPSLNLELDWLPASPRVLPIHPQLQIKQVFFLYSKHFQLIIFLVPDALINTVLGFITFTFPSLLV